MKTRACPECGGNGIFDRIDVWTIPCMVCDGKGTIEVATVNDGPFLGFPVHVDLEKTEVALREDGSYDVTYVIERVPDAGDGKEPPR